MPAHSDSITDLTHNHEAGFTLIELLVSLSLSVFLLLAASSMFMIMLLSNTKISGSNTIEQQGDRAMQTMTYFVRNAKRVVASSDNSVCVSGMSQLAVESFDGQVTEFAVVNDNGTNKIASNSGTFLTSNAVEVVDENDDGINNGPQDLKFNCSYAFNQQQPSVEIEFTLRKGVPGVDEPQEIVEQTFTSRATLRSY